MGKFVDITGETFNYLRVIRRIDIDKKRAHWLCVCTHDNCGNGTIALTQQLRNGTKKSCGCVKTKRCKTFGLHHTHDLSSTKLYKVWGDMKQRCYNSNASGYKDYGGRGIRVCNDWLTFEGFHLWATEQGIDENCCNSEGVRLTIERKDVDGNYEPDNCCWIPKSEQNKNKRNTVYIDGMTVSDYACKLGVSKRSIQHKLARGKLIPDTKPM